jgi:ribosomal protein S18 acetylase RimI-like enzyme
VKSIQVGDIDAARLLSNRNPDVFGSYVVERLPDFWEIADMALPAYAFADRQQLMLGAFHGDRIVGTVFVTSGAMQLSTAADESVWEMVRARYTDHIVDVYATLQKDILKSMIPSPSRGHLIHTLCVDSAYRRQGIAKSLLLEVTNTLNSTELAALYIQIARIKGHLRLCESVGFKVVRKRFSPSDRLQFGIWGSILLKFDPSPRSRGAKES